MLALLCSLWFWLAGPPAPPVPLIRYENPAYRLFFDPTTRLPVYVSYKLYQGGGVCDRSQFSFRTAPGSASSKDYARSGYDEGHLVPAEDFASNCDLERFTFSFYNCAPQLPLLNRGIWARYEAKIREASQCDSLLVQSGTWVGRRRVQMGRVVVPVLYWKTVQSLSTGQYLFCFLVTNSTRPKLVPTTPVLIQGLCPVPLLEKRF